MGNGFQDSFIYYTYKIYYYINILYVYIESTWFVLRLYKIIKLGFTIKKEPHSCDSFFI